MKIKRVFPKPPPEFTMTFSRDDGWAIVAALADYARTHPGAAHVIDWKTWAADLDKELGVASERPSDPASVIRAALEQLYAIGDADALESRGAWKLSTEAESALEALAGLEREAAEREAALAEAQSSLSAHNVGYWRERTERAEARVREVEAERDLQTRRKNEWFDEAARRGATVARQAETLSDLIEWAARRDRETHSYAESATYVEAKPIQAARAVLASPEAPAAEPRARICKGSTRHARDCGCAKCVDSATEVEVSPLTYERLRKTARTLDCTVSAALEEVMREYRVPAVDAPPRSYFAHETCGATWTLPDDVDVALCPNCNVQVTRRPRRPIGPAVDAPPEPRDE